MGKQATIFGEMFVDVDKNTDKMLINKIRKPLTPSVSRGVAEIYDEVERVFTKVKTLIPYVEQYELITTNKRLNQYLEKIIDNGVVAIDTETDGLNIKKDRIAGVSIYTKGENPAYIPINHDYYDNNMLVKDVGNFLQAIKDNEVKVVMHNARFDIRVIVQNFKVRLQCYFDTLIASKLLNENETENSLKALWTKHVLSKDVEYFKYNDLFSGIKFSAFNPEKVVVYPALDALMTLELFNFFDPFLDGESDKCVQQDLVDTSDLFHNIEMKVLDIAINMEERGVSIDKAYAKDLEISYTKRMAELEGDIQTSLTELMPLIKENLLFSDLQKLSDPININSPAQLSMIFYRGLKMKLPTQGKLASKGASVDKEVLVYLGEEYQEYDHILSKLLEYKGIAKILGTYLVAIPQEVDPTTNRLHASWNTVGTVTGRFSSSSPNLQNIPSKNQEIRPMFVPKDGCVFVGCDYNAQEPRVLAALSQDPVLVKNYKEGNDIYATLASMAYKLPYDQCTKETKEGKVRRNHGKVLQLALSYGMQAKSLGQQLNMPLEEAEALYKAFKENLSTVFEFEGKKKQFCKAHGYVKTLWGRKRRFPDYLLPQFQVVGDIAPETKKQILSKLSRMYRADRFDYIKEMEANHGIAIYDNSRKISDCDTQILNSIIQGSSADMTKVALCLVEEDERLRQLDAYLVLVIHDEIILECPKDNAEQAKEILEELMAKAAQQRITSIDFKAEGEIMERWHKD